MAVIRTGGLPFEWWENQAAVDGAFAQGEGEVLPTVVGAVALSSTEVQVTFSEEMKHVNPLSTDDALHPVNYVFTGSVAVTAQSVALSQADPTIVVVTTNEMTLGASYDVQVNDVESALGVGLSSTGNTASFTGIGIGPRVAEATASIFSVRVVFDSAMSDTGLTEAGNYTFGGPTTLDVDTVSKVDSAQVNITFLGEMINGLVYTITVENVVDEADNVIDPAHNEGTFIGIAEEVVEEEDEGLVAAPAEPRSLPGVVVYQNRD